MIDPRQKTSGSSLGDLQKGSAFKTLATKLGMAAPPANVPQLITYLQQFLSEPQLELVNYMFQSPQAFQMADNITSPGEPSEMVGTVEPIVADVPPAADDAAKASRDATPPPAAVTPTPATQEPSVAPAASQAPPKPTAAPVLSAEERIKGYSTVPAGTKAPATDRVKAGQVPRFTVTLPSGEKQNIY